MRKMTTLYLTLISALFCGAVPTAHASFNPYEAFGIDPDDMAFLFQTSASLARQTMAYRPEIDAVFEDPTFQSHMKEAQEEIEALFPQPHKIAASSGISILFSDEEIKDVVRLCKVSYGPEQPFHAQLLEHGWDIVFHSNNVDSRPYVITAQKEETTVIAYKGTDTWEEFAKDLSATPEKANKLYPGLKGSFHGGMGGIYQQQRYTRAPELLRDLDLDAEDTLILAGHSLGGALATFGLLDITHKKREFEHLNPSVFTFGAPAVLDRKLCSILDTLYMPTLRHWRFYFDNDPVVNATLIYDHAGFGIQLPHDGIVSHKCKTYIKAVDAFLSQHKPGR
ncbi:MAG: lipase family protein [Holosporales bacterium]